MKALPLNWGHKRQFLEIPPQPPVAFGDRIQSWFANFSPVNKMILLVIGMMVGLYIGLGFVRCFGVCLMDKPGIGYEPILDFWWTTLLRLVGLGS
jgi:hypothetical protein